MNDSSNERNLEEIVVGPVPVDSATLIVGDPLYVDSYWVKLGEAEPDGVTFAGGIGMPGRAETNSRVVGEKLEAEGHRVEWADAAGSAFTAWPGDASGSTLEQFRDHVLEMVGGAGAPGTALLGFGRPSATLTALNRALTSSPAAALPLRRESTPNCVGFRLGGDGVATIRAFVDEDQFVRRIIIEYQ